MTEDINKLREWLSSAEGQAAMKKAQEEAEKFCKQLEEDAKVSWEDLLKPINI